MKRKILGLFVAGILIATIGNIAAQSNDKENEQEMIEKYGKIYTEELKGESFSNSKGSCSLGTCSCHLSWYKPPMSLRIHHYANTTGQGYEQMYCITSGGSVTGATMFIYASNGYNTAWHRAYGDGWGSWTPTYGYTAHLSASAKFRTYDDHIDTAYSSASGP